jgi:hypothetical protein
LDSAAAQAGFGFSFIFVFIDLREPMADALVADALVNDDGVRRRRPGPFKRRTARSSVGLRSTSTMSETGYQGRRALTHVHLPGPA